MRKTRALLTAFVWLGIWPGIGSGLNGAVRSFSFEELTQQSKYVLTGTVVDMRAYWTSFAPGAGVEFIVTDVTLKVETTLKGKLETSEVTVQFLGGRLDGGDDSWQLCPDSAVYTPGERVLVFLREFRGHLWNTGWLQGKYTLSSDGKLVRGRPTLPIAAELPLEKVRNQVRLYAVRATEVDPSSVRVQHVEERPAEQNPATLKADTAGEDAAEPDSTVAPAREDR
jgi:hypothetical protein